MNAYGIYGIIAYITRGREYMRREESAGRREFRRRVESFSGDGSAVGEGRVQGGGSTGGRTVVYSAHGGSVLRDRSGTATQVTQVSQAISWVIWRVGGAGRRPYSSADCSSVRDLIARPTVVWFDFPVL